MEQHSQPLSLRGTLPPRPRSHRLRPHQQGLSLGLAATPSGLKATGKEAKIIAAKLLENPFRWQDYERVKGLGPLGELSLGEQIAAFETPWLAQGNLSCTTRETAYAPYLRRLLKAAAAHPDYA
ncbi:recombinase-like protein [Thermosynechococcus vestitus]|uniref:Tlr2211 protein n=1 Tax=Thermosynechococcus vestitus (strain NIES-2133 / IAM M-273 / BP-1) TaxID=197221 RepID=Q8DGV1_THEVB|nr:recombinase-like protein [Thermosynechococcus vestitus]BAC09763.1 tlr2211 [Thermosynechococcus vestitus BP-1]